MKPDGDTPLFVLPARILHWLMAVLILTMLFIGVGMAATLSEKYRVLLSIHRPLGATILVLALVRLLVRRRNPPPPLPAHMSGLEKAIAHASHWILYALMIALPLVGWAMLSAGRYPIVLFGPLRLPPILPPDIVVFAALRRLHSWLAFALFAVVLAHVGAALRHALILRDGVFRSMASPALRSRRR
jgi:cytochrome b561